MSFILDILIIVFGFISIYNIIEYTIYKIKKKETEFDTLSFVLTIGLSVIYYYLYKCGIFKPEYEQLININILSISACSIMTIISLFTIDKCLLRTILVTLSSIVFLISLYFTTKICFFNYYCEIDYSGIIGVFIAMCKLGIIFNIVNFILYLCYKLDIRILKRS